MVCSHPIQYLAPWFRKLAAHPELDITVFYGDDHGLRAGFDPEFQQTVRWDVDLTSGYRFVTLRNHAPRPGVGPFFGIFSADLFKVLTKDRFDAVVIQGWNYALYPLALLAAKLYGLPVIIRCESVLLPEAAQKAAWKRHILKRYLSACAAALAVSSGNRRLLLSYGVPPERIFFSPYAVDGARFALPKKERDAARARWRKKLGITDDKTPLLLFCGKLISVKAPALLLESFFTLRSQGIAAHLLFCGDGELRDSLERQAQGRQDVAFSGFVNQSELPALYAAADALVLPSQRETFGIVVLEAMHTGLPVIASEGVGCAADLVPDELRFAAGDGAALFHCLRLLTEGPEAEARRADFSARAARRAATWTYIESTQGLLSALHSIFS